MKNSLHDNFWIVLVLVLLLLSGLGLWLAQYYPADDLRYSLLHDPIMRVAFGIGIVWLIVTYFQDQ